MKVPGTCTDDRPLSANTSGGIRPWPTELNPNDPYDRDRLRDPIRSNIDEHAFACQFDNDLQVDPELAEGPASNSRIALFAVGIAIVLGLVFYGLNNSSSEPAERRDAPARRNHRAEVGLDLAARASRHA